MKQRILLGAEYSILEPLALFYLASIAKSEGLEQKIIMGNYPEYPEWKEAIDKFNPSLMGLTVYTGNHTKIAEFVKKIRAEKPDLKIITGGPHATYFPKQSLEFSDYVVVGEGFNSFRRIIRGESPPGILLPQTREPFPSSFREDFYKDSPKHLRNRIKNVILGTGCPFNCSHCYNSADIKDMEDFNEIDIKNLKKIYPSGRFFPPFQRSIKEVINEIEELQKISSETKFLFLEDDIFGMDLKWLRQFSKEYHARIPYHANMRFEFVDPEKDSGKERIDLLIESGCTGLSFAIECSDPVICKETLGRNHNEDLIFRVMHAMKNAGLKVRTYQMIGLPYGATTKPTKINLEADLNTLSLNVRLIKETGLPTFVWASTLAPYPGTKISDYCIKHGFYNGIFDNLSGNETYRIRSVLSHVKRWIGPELSPADYDVWLSHEEQEEYRDKLSSLMNYFPVLAMIPKGDELARKFLNQKDLSSAGLNKACRTFVYDNSLFV